MIQRIQSIFLAISGASFFGLFGLPFATSSVAIPNYMSDLRYDISDSTLLLILTLLGGIISIATIFLFNNRSLQLKLSNAIAVVAILLPLLAFLLIYNEQTITTQSDKISDGFGLYLPIIALVFAILANRYINKDEKTVQSMDRLR